MKANSQTQRKPRLIIVNIPEDISTANLEDTLLAQNPDLHLKKETSKLNSATKQKNRSGTW